MSWVIWFLIATLVAIASAICSFVIKRSGKKQLSKYSKENSPLVCSSVEDLSLKLSSVDNVKICDVNPETNMVNLICENYVFTIKIEDGKAFVVYDMSGFGTYFSPISKTISSFTAPKSAKKAIIINEVMDQIVGSDEVDYTKLKTNLQINTTIVIFGFIAFVVCLIISILDLFVGSKNDAISNVKDDLFYYDSYQYSTYEELIDEYIPDAKWSAFDSDQNCIVVEVMGTSIYDEIICIQFVGETGGYYDSAESQEFTLEYFEADGDAINAQAAMEYIYEAVYY